MEKFINLLEHTTVKIVSKTGNLLGTGFFISENLIATAAHVINKVDNYHIEYPSNNFIIDQYELLFDSAAFDISILKIKEIEPRQVVYLGTDMNINDDLVAYGYSVENKFGEYLSLSLEGKASNTQSVYKHKVKDGQVNKGISGSPVLCVQSGQVVGIMVETRNKDLPSGGYFIPFAAILGDGADILAYNRAYHLEHPSWNSRYELDQLDVSMRNETWKSAHFNVFNSHSNDVEEVFIAPKFEEIIYEHDDFHVQKNSSEVFSVCLEILDEQSVLLITGSYGAGKSLLTKCLQKKLIRHGKNTVFIAANTFRNEKNDYHAFKKALARRLYSQANLYVFIDAFDELQSLDADDSQLLFEDIVKLVKSHDGFLIVNYRTLRTENLIKQYEYQAMILSDALDLSAVRILNIREFSSDHVREWLDNHAIIKRKAGVEKVLMIEHIYAAHKNLIVACHNPLFLYIVNQSFYAQKQTLDSINNIYDLYEGFVNDTVKGKFVVETKSGSNVLAKITKYYLSFLKEIALNIAKHSQKFSASLDDSDHFLDNNMELMGIPESNISAQIKAILALLIPHAEEFKSENIDTVLLNCYFFEQTSEVWRFRDNNILFYFIAEKLYSCINKAIELTKKVRPLKEIFGELKSASTIPLHPIVIELLLRKVISIGKEDRRKFVGTLKTLIKGEYFLSVTEVPTALKIDFEKINLDILLCILFVQLNDSGYNEITFFFKRFVWLLSIAKRLNPKMVFLAKRFFKGAKIYDAEFRRVNLKDCNFDQTILKQVTFIQTKLHDVRKNNSKFENVKYLLCDIRHTQMENIDGKIIFDTCILNSLTFKEHREKIYLTFERCKIENLEIVGNQTTHVFLIFRNCSIENISIRRTRVKQLYMESNVVENFKIESSRVNVMLGENIFKKDFDQRHGCELVPTIFEHLE